LAGNPSKPLTNNPGHRAGVFLFPIILLSAVDKLQIIWIYAAIETARGAKQGDRKCTI
jgi:hypothetical protein